MTSTELRASFLGLLRAPRPQGRSQLSARAARRSDVALHERRDEPVQGRVPGTRSARRTRGPPTSQKCMRVSGKHNDLDNVGPSLRHHTFFEMLGNFSFGDYFKKDAIALRLGAADRRLGAVRRSAVTPRFQGRRRYPARRRGLQPVARLSAGRADPRAGRRRQLLVDGRYGAVRSMLGDPLLSRQRPPLHRRPRASGSACDCDRFVEIWNNVFMEFDRQADGTLKPLPKPSIDTGMGLERITAIMQGTLSNYDTDVFAPLLARDRRAGRAQHYRGTMEPRRRLDARRRRPPARHDVPHRRRRAAEQRVARLRAAQDHAAGDAPREAARRDRAIPPSPGRRAGRQMGDAYPELRGRPRHDRPGDSRRGGSLRRRAHRRPAEARRAARQRRGGGQHAFRRRGVQAVRHLRPAARLHRGPRERAEADAGSRGVRARHGRRSARRRAPKSAFDGKRRGVRLHGVREPATACGRRRSVRRLHDHRRSKARRIVGALR